MSMRFIKTSWLAGMLLGLGVVVGERPDGTVPLFESLTQELDAATCAAAKDPTTAGSAATRSLRESYVMPVWEDVVLSVPTRPPAA